MPRLRFHNDIKVKNLFNELLNTSVLDLSSKPILATKLSEIHKDFVA